MLISTAPQKPQSDHLDRFRFRVAFAAGTVILAFALLICNTVGYTVKNIILYRENAGPKILHSVAGEERP